MAQVKKAAEKPAAKKTVTKKATASVKTKIELQYAEKNISYDDIVKNAKEFWTLELGNKAEDLKSLDLYVKPEENRVYYVANGKETGSFEL
ncbi:MAG: hypothetical protein IIZ20_03490 [Butyrivibrio sp.]|jgi:hypothetical protein|uniref:Uncharacterized protein n=1 Tax=Butyrivibrio fibrisolvens TaxID=831 RepID=A0A317G3S2_BUTFI|nr:DUF6465 family protein [Butyrivibrio fibrisolvens]MBQ1457543.1 hypothetical protein [Butyrivibrio sp.]MCR4634680.1 DUF6465 family protein [Butyrivibrio sp.]PWT28628.1 hypothetical protein CPT75_16670 [Butyrivibrio fibrisolvens]